MSSMSNREVVISLMGAFVATLAASYFSYMILAAEQTPLVLASTGASAILIFAVPHSSVSQNWHLVGGHVVSVLVGVTHPAPWWSNSYYSRDWRRGCLFVGLLLCYFAGIF